MRNVLVIVYAYPPIADVGVHRTQIFTKNLKRWGYNPIILTVKKYEKTYSILGKKQKEKLKVYRTRKIETPFAFIYPVDKVSGWVPYIIREGMKIIKKEKIDLIYVSCPPWSSAVGAYLLSKVSKVPFVVDFRDAWVFNPYRRSSVLDRLLEKKVLKKASLLITTSRDSERQHRIKYPSLRIKTIYTGYDKLFNFKPDFREFNILYSGSYEYGRTPENFLKAIKEINKNDIQFISFSPNNSVVRDLAEKYNLRESVRLFDYVQHDKFLSYLGKASMFLLLQPRAGKTENAIPRKTFEYLSTGVPIVADIPHGDIARVLKKYSSKAYITYTDDSASIKKGILSCYDQWKNKKLKFKIDEAYIREFSPTNVTKELARSLIR